MPARGNAGAASLRTVAADGSPPGAADTAGASPNVTAKSPV